MKHKLPLTVFLIGISRRFRIAKQYRVYWLATSIRNNGPGIIRGVVCQVSFSGHEKVRMVDSPLGKIPEGWGLATFAEGLSYLESGSRPEGGIGPKILKGNI